MVETRDAEIHHLIGGALCLDFANTLYGHTELIHEYLFNYRDLVLWSRHAGIVSAQKAQILLSEGEQSPVESDAVFRQAIQIREMVFRVFSHLAQSKSPEDADLNQLHRTWLENQAYLRLEQAVECYELVWEDSEALDSLLWPVMHSAMDLLTSDELKRLKQCGRCDWLFLDKSRNQKRRWCSMSACGNRVKMARRYERTKRGE